MVIAFTENNDIVLTKQYRHALGDFYLELPAGVVGPGEDPKAAAIRELAEETGYGADHFELLAKLAPSPGKIKGVWHVYLALKASKRYEVQLDPSEEIEVSAVPASEVLQMIRHGEITADTTIAPVYMACEKLGLLRK